MPLRVPPAVENNTDAIVRAIGLESVDVYRFLQQRLATADPAEDRLFQFLFRSFYRIDNAGLTPEFKTRFFEILRDAKIAGAVTIADVVRSLHLLPNRKGQTSLQFSFATKLAASIDSTVPIYDKEVAGIFGFRAPYTTRSFEQRLAEYLEFHAELASLYEAIVAEDRLRGARSLFRQLYAASPSTVPETKVLDFIFWAAGKLSRE